MIVLTQFVKKGHCGILKSFDSGAASFGSEAGSVGSEAGSFGNEAGSVGSQRSRVLCQRSRVPWQRSRCLGSEAGFCARVLNLPKTIRDLRTLGTFSMPRLLPCVAAEANDQHALGRHYRKVLRSEDVLCI